MESPTNGTGCFPSSSVDSTEEEISLYLKTINTISLKVKRYETISNLKSMICEKAGISENVQELFFVGNRLKNDRRLVDYGIPQGSTLHLVLQNLVAMRIYVQTPSAQKIIADLRTYDTIQSIKSIIQAKEGIQPDRYTLIHNGKVLDNDLVLAALNIPNESTIHLIFNPKDVIPIFVRTETGEILKLEVKVLHTVHDVKAIIESMTGVLVKDIHLIYAGKRVEDCKTLASYDIKEEATLVMFPAMMQNLVAMRIYVKTPSAQKLIAVDLRTYDTIQSIKSIIQAKEGIQPDRYTLIQNGKVLENDRILAALNIPNESTIHLIFNPKDVVPIFVRTVTRKILKLEVKVLHTVHDVKAIIESMTGVLVNDFDLVYEGKRVEGSKTLASYDIKEEATLEMFPAMMQIFLKTWSGKTITLDVQKSDTISDLWRNIVYKLRMNVSLSNMRIVFAGKRLNWDKDLASNGVQMHSTLHVVFLPKARIWPMKLADIRRKPIQNFTTIRILKSMIEKKIKASVKGIYFQGTALQDDRSLTDYRINSDASVEVIY